MSRPTTIVAIAQAAGVTRLTVSRADCRLTDRRHPGRKGWLHYNADWYLLEPVDTYRPVPAGTRSDTVLVTSLTNRLMPVIRYDQGATASCSNPNRARDSAYPAIRADDLLNLPARNGGGGTVTVTPLSLVAAIEEVPGVYRIRVVHRTPDDLEFRLQVLPSADEGAAWSAVTTRAHDHLGKQGAGPVTLRRSPEPPIQRPTCGRYAQVINLRGQALHHLLADDQQPHTN